MISKEDIKMMVETVIRSTGKTQTQLSIEMGYGYNYISDMLSPSGKVSEKFAARLKNTLA